MVFRTALTMLLCAGLIQCQQLSFEVASIKLSPVKAGAYSPENNGPATLSMGRSTLQLLIASAYDVTNQQVVGGPAWCETELYDVEAKSAVPVTRAQKMEMLRGLIAERFNLKFHREQRPLSVYTLVVAKDGPKYGPQFHVVRKGDPTPQREAGKVVLRETMKQLASFVGAPILAGRIFPAPGEQPLTLPEPMPVIDMTGLEGEYDIVIDLNRINDWFAVLPPQLGLKLEPRKIKLIQSSSTA